MHSIKDRAQVFSISTLITAALYIFTTASHITLMDSGDLILGAQTLGVVHPPGYPLFVMLGFLFSKIFFFLEPAHQIHLMNALFGAFATGVLSLLVFELDEKQRKAPAIFAGLCLALTSMTWRLATATEVYTLNLLLNNLAWLLAFRFRKSPANRTFFVLCFVIGLALSNCYPLIILSGIGLIFVLPFSKLKPKLCLQGLGFLALGLLPYLYLFIQSQRLEQIPYVFFDMSSFDQVIGYIMRNQYGHWDQRSTTFVQKILVFGQLLRYFALEFSLNTAFIVAGFYAAFKSRHVLRWPLFIAIIASSFVLAVLIGTSTEEGSFVLLGEYLLPTLAYFAIFATLGAIWLWENVPSARILIPAVCIAGLITQGFHAFPFANQRNELAVENWGTQLLNSLPPNANLIYCGDEVFPILYLQMIKGVRPDVKTYSTYMAGENYLYSKGPGIKRSLAQKLTLKQLVADSTNPVHVTHCGKKYAPQGYNVVLKGLSYQLLGASSPESQGITLDETKLRSILDSILLGPAQKNYWMSFMRRHVARMLLAYATQNGVIGKEKMRSLIKSYGVTDDKEFSAAIGVEFAYLGDLEETIAFFRQVPADDLDSIDPENVAVYCRVLLLRGDKETARKVCLIPDAVQVCNADAKYNLGRAFWDEKAKSLDYLRAANRCDPSVELIRQTLQKREEMP